MAEQVKTIIICGKYSTPEKQDILMPQQIGGEGKHAGVYNIRTEDHAYPIGMIFGRIIFQKWRIQAHRRQSVSLVLEILHGNN